MKFGLKWTRKKIMEEKDEPKQISEGDGLTCIIITSFLWSLMRRPLGEMTRVNQEEDMVCETCEAVAVWPRSW